MQGDRQHVGQRLTALGISVARQQWREDMPAPSQQGEKRTFLDQPAGAVQKHQWWAVAGLDHADLAAAGDIEQKRAGGHGRTSATLLPGTARRGSGWILKQSSLS